MQILFLSLSGSILIGFLIIVFKIVRMITCGSRNSPSFLSRMIFMLVVFFIVMNHGRQLPIRYDSNTLGDASWRTVFLRD